MTEYYDDEYDEYADEWDDDYPADDDAALLETYNPGFQINQPAAWPQRKSSLSLGTIFWSVGLVGLTVGTILYFDMLPKDIESMAEIADPSEGSAAELNSSKSPNPFEQNAFPETSHNSNNQPVASTTETPPFEQPPMHNVVDEWDTEDKVKHRKRRLSAPASFLVLQDAASQSWTGPPLTETVKQANHVRESQTAALATNTNSRPAKHRIQLAAAEENSTEPTGKAPAPLPTGGQQIDFTSIDKLMKSGADLEALRELSKLYWDRPQERELFIERIETVAESIFFSRQHHYLAPYEVQPGDQLAVIAKEYRVPWQYLARLNRVNPRNIRPGQKLKVIKGPFSVFIDLSEFEMTLHSHGYFVKRFPIGIGKNDTSLLGTFKVLKKLEDPTYYGPDGVVIEAKDPDNPLGERWIDIGDSYGIHGTIDDKSIGKAESRGCIRMLNSDVAEVFDFLSVGSEVVIQK